MQLNLSLRLKVSKADLGLGKRTCFPCVRFVSFKFSVINFLLIVLEYSWFYWPQKCCHPPGPLVTMMFEASLQLILWRFIAHCILISRFSTLPKSINENYKYIKKVHAIQSCHLKNKNKKTRQTKYVMLFHEQQFLVIKGKPNRFFPYHF